MQKRCLAIVLCCTPQKAGYVSNSVCLLIGQLPCPSPQMILLVAFLILSLCCLCILFFGNNLKRPQIIGPVLIVTAHPDDECMFFSPVILALNKWNIPVDLLCLSSGNFYGMGKVRADELKSSANVLRIRHFKVINDETLPDDPEKTWPVATIVKYVERTSQKWQSRTIISFDSEGVSGHSNHCQIYHAICSPNTQLGGMWRYSLKSQHVVLKYCLFLTILMSSFLKNQKVLCSPLCDIFVPHKAMFQHRSQLMWFRYLYIMFSSYMFINVIEPIPKPTRKA